MTINLQYFISGIRLQIDTRRDAGDSGAER